MTNWVERFFEAIDDSAIGKMVSKRRELLERTDPDRVYVEDVRSFFGVTAGMARRWCKLAVREGVFEERIALLCPEHKHLLASVSSGASTDPGEQFTCEVCEEDEIRDQPYRVDELRRLTFYRLLESPESADDANQKASASL